jgi:uncharacterized protein YyaL (SSP411 family)
MTKKNFSLNNLQEEKSLYLLQHADQPIHWQPWSQDLLEVLKSQSKNIFISIGYSSCHWCHVLSQESFYSETNAEFLNENFVCIKIDREEFPEIDSYYQAAAQKMGKNGGWPLSVFLTPEAEVIFIGTYFPPVDRKGVPSFFNLCKEISNYAAQEKDQISKQSQEVLSQIAENILPKEKVEFPGHFPSAASILKAMEHLEDKAHGGYGSAPKFPQFAFYESLVEQILEGVVPAENAKQIQFSLEKMLSGGLFDHAKGGIHRYATDAKYAIPHFEKMLYDQAGFLSLYSKYSLMAPSPLIFDSILMTMEYLLSEMFHEEKSYFFSAQDADSEGMEGLFFTFTEAEFEDALVQYDESLSDQMDYFKKIFCITSKGNFDQGLNTIQFDWNNKADYYPQEKWELIRKVKKSLLEARKQRTPPATDTKGIASWNFLLLNSLVDVIQYCPVDIIKKLAHHLLTKSIEGIHQNFFVQDPEKGINRIKSVTTLPLGEQYFEDYVFFAQSQFRLYQLSGNKSFLTNATSSMEYIQHHFWKNNVCWMLSEGTKSPFNKPVSHFDQSYKSPMATYYGLLVKMDLLGVHKRPEIMEPLCEQLKSWSLINPMNHGEALKTLIFPKEAFKIMKVPYAWIQEAEFSELMPYFSSRFIFDYKDGSDEWQICTHSHCEAQGKTIAEFKKTIVGTNQ